MVGRFSVELDGWLVGLDDGQALHVQWSEQYRSFVVALCGPDLEVRESWGLDSFAELPSRADVEWVLSSAGFGGLVPWVDAGFRAAVVAQGAPASAL